MTQQNYVLKRAAAAWRENNGVLPADIAMALSNAGLFVEDVIVYINEEDSE